VFGDRAAGGRLIGIQHRLIFRTERYGPGIVPPDTFAAEMKKPLLLAISIMFTGMIMAQEHSDRCKAHTITERHLVQQGLPASIMDALPRIENAGDRGQVLTVPVVVHVVWNTSAENVPSSAIHDMIAEMNADYSETNSDIR